MWMPNTLVQEGLIVIFLLFLGSIGGSLGLCLGVSILTLIEFFHLILELISTYKCCGKSKRRTLDKIQSNGGTDSTVVINNGV